MWYRRSKISITLLSAGLLIVPATAFANQVQSTICTTLSTPTITAPAAASETTEASVQVTGYAQPGKTVLLTKNNVGSGATTATADGTYALSTPLAVGSNTLNVSVSNACNTVKQSITVAVRRIEAPATNVSQPTATPSPSTTPTVPAPTQVATPVAPVAVTSLNSTPIITPTATDPTSQQTVALAPSIDEPDNSVSVSQKQVITDPREGETVKSDRMWIKGEALPNSAVAVYINKQIAAQVVADALGSYGVLVEVKSGSNVIHVKATAKDGSQTTRVINVKLVKSTKPEPAAVTTNKNNDTLARSISLAIGAGSLLIMAGIYHEIHHLNLKKSGGKHA